jgi:tRNA(Arg) A34 adenosine deaminase TadA
MLVALAEARRALGEGEMPVGCALVCEDSRNVLATARNATNAQLNATAHAEVLALRAFYAAFPSALAARARLRRCTLFVTVEPCIMCAAALAACGVTRVVFGCPNDKFGGCGTLLSVHEGAAVCLYGEASAGSVAGGSAAEGGFAVVQNVRKEQAVGLLKDFYRRPNPRVAASPV